MHKEKNHQHIKCRLFHPLSGVSQMQASMPFKYYLFAKMINSRHKVLFYRENNVKKY